MSCALCTSVNESEFTAKIMIHSSGPMRVDNPGVLAFPKIAVCMDCGFSRFTTTEAQLQSLSKRIAAICFCGCLIAIGCLRLRRELLTRPCPQCDRTTSRHRPKTHRLHGKVIIPLSLSGTRQSRTRNKACVYCSPDERVPYVVPIMRITEPGGISC
jgi:hypothetical protein